LTNDGSDLYKTNIRFLWATDEVGLVPRVSEEHRQARRQQILDAAVRCFSREGFHRATMADIFEEAGLSAGAVYGHFAGKDELIEAIAEERRAGESLLLKIAFDGQDDLRAAFGSFLGPLFAWLSEPGEQAKRRVGVQVWAEALRNERIRRLVLAATEQRSIAVDAIEAGRERGDLPTRIDADALARVVLGAIQGFILQQAWEPDLDPAPYAAAIELMLDGLFDRTES
jgi:TetR/AcrR family transcriptional regulator, repressor for uid operon